jgi:hypothetical protein
MVKNEGRELLVCFTPTPPQIHSNRSSVTLLLDMCFTRELSVVGVENFSFPFSDLGVLR